MLQKIKTEGKKKKKKPAPKAPKLKLLINLGYLTSSENHQDSN